LCVINNVQEGVPCGDPSDYSVCDRPDTCDGAGLCEPNIATSDTVCYQGSDFICDPDEYCTATSRDTCPHFFASAGTECGNGTDFSVCDRPDTCDGAGSCDPNIAEETTVCNEGSGDLCDPPEYCSGFSGDECLDDLYEPATTQCRPSGTGDLKCDPPENCPGVPDQPCPPDFVEPVTTLCGDGTTTQCTDPDTCDGLGECLLFHNKPCGSATDSSLCEFDMEPTKGTCVVPHDVLTSSPPAPEACFFDPDCEDLGGAICSLNAPCLDSKGAETACFNGGACLDADGTYLGGCTPDYGCSGDCEQTDQFRLIFTPDAQNWEAFKLNASNPGQTYYNLIYDATGVNGNNVVLTVKIPYPYVTVGGNPLHVYDADTVPSDGSGCLDPENAVAVPITAASPFSITLEDWTTGAAGTGDYNLTCPVLTGPDDSGYCTFEVEVDNADIPASGLIYLNVHLNFGLKGKFVDANPVGPDGSGIDDDRYDIAGIPSQWGSATALVNNDTDDGPTGLSDCRSFWFSHTDNGAFLFEDQLQNLNIFKGISGVFGQSIDSFDGEGLEGLHLTLSKTDNPTTVLKASTTDEDGSYTLLYKHKGKPTWYDVNLYDETGEELLGSITIELQGNGWTQVTFDADGDPCDAESAFCECNGWCAAAEYGSGRQSGDSSGGGGGGGSCELAQSGQSCEVDADCCSNSCKGKQGNKTCK
jgi:hypothetical protein